MNMMTKLKFENRHTLSHTTKVDVLRNNSGVWETILCFEKRFLVLGREAGIIKRGLGVDYKQNPTKKKVTFTTKKSQNAADLPS